MPYASGYSTAHDTGKGVQEACDMALTQLRGAAPDLSFLFVHQGHSEAFAQIVAAVQESTGSRHLLACMAEAIVANEREIEEPPGLSLWCAALPGAVLESFRVEFERTPDGLICSGIPEPQSDTAAVRAVLLLGDPHSCAVDTLIARLEDDFPGTPLLGGMASGGRAPGENLLGWNGQVTGGGIGVIVRGGPRIESVVSQGCRPIGSTLVVTRAERNVIFELGGKPALARLEETYAGLPSRDRELIRQGLHLGLVMDEYKPNFSRGDFLIANVLGADRESGAIALGNLVRPGQTVQFHVRDAQAADEDLRHLLSARLADLPAPPAGALLFTCNGRGTRFFFEPDHDAGVLRELCGSIPAAGFFAQGELGPVGGRNHIHGFTASLALFVDV
ncbi:MAG: FIST signal transduction protein [Planctomycetaceae bacterium]